MFLVPKGSFSSSFSSCFPGKYVLGADFCVPDNEVFLVFGKHFADARQMAHMTPSLRNALGLHELTAPANIFPKDFSPRILSLE